ncbi:unnamed protein product [Aphanomyces euteiches]
METQILTPVPLDDGKIDRPTYYERNRDQVRENQRMYRESNREKIRAIHKAYYLKNRAKITAYKRERWHQKKAASKDNNHDGSLQPKSPPLPRSLAKLLNPADD